MDQAQSCLCVLGAVAASGASIFLQRTSVHVSVSALADVVTNAHAGARPFTVFSCTCDHVLLVFQAHALHIDCSLAEWHANTNAGTLDLASANACVCTVIQDGCLAVVLSVQLSNACIVRTGQEVSFLGCVGGSCASVVAVAGFRLLNP